MSAFQPVAIGPSDITADWLSEVLSTDFESVFIASVKAERVGTGQIGTTYRLHLSYEDGTAGPNSIIAKLAAEDPAARTAVAAGYRKEVGFYETFADSLAIRVPHCFYAAIAPGAETFTLLLEDLANARPGVQADGCTVEQASAALTNLAGLHGPTWNDPALYDVDYVEPMTAAAADFIGVLLTGATGQFLTRYAEELDPQDKDTLKQSASAMAAWLAQPSIGEALSHGDYRLDNLMFGPLGEVTALDWQTLSVAPPLRDVAYFIGTCLDTDLRRAHERRLVEGYRQALASFGVDDLDDAECFEAYRLGHLQSPLITVIGCEYATAVRTAQADGMFLAMARRSCAAIRDHQTLDLVR